MTAAPLVSVGLPVFNGERYLSEAIGSVLGQDVDALELVISDNASTDDTEEICRDVASRDDRVRFVRSSENRGAAWNYNRVFELARGTYFKWAAHDDVCDASYLSRSVEVLGRRPEVPLCHANTVRIDSAGREIGRDEPFAVASEPDVAARVHSLLLTPTPCFEVFGVARRSVLVETGLIRPFSGSDRVLLIELALRGPFHLIDEYLFYNRDHDTRSIRAFRDPHARNLWFDPSRMHAQSAPRWRLLREYAVAINRASVPTADRLRCFAALARWSRSNGTGLARGAARYAWQMAHPNG